MAERGSRLHLSALLVALLVALMPACHGGGRQAGPVDVGGDAGDAAAAEAGEPDDEADEDEDAGEGGPSAPPSWTYQVDAELPAEGQEFYLFESVSMRGHCDGGTPSPRYQVVDPGGGVRTVEGSELTLSFSLVGAHRISFACAAEAASKSVSITVLPTPSIVYRANAAGYDLLNQLYATPLDAPGTARRLSPEAEPNAEFGTLVYRPGHGALYTRLYVGDSVNWTLAACDGMSCPTTAPRLERALVMRGCAPQEITWAPDGNSAVAYYACGAVVGTYWLTVGPNGELERAALLANQWVQFFFTQGSNDVVFQLYGQLLYFDAAHPETTSRVLCAAERWALSASGGKLVVASQGNLIQIFDLTQTSFDALLANQVSYFYQYSSYGSVVTAEVDLGVLVSAMVWDSAQGAWTYPISLLRYDGSGTELICQSCYVAGCGRRVVFGGWAVQPTVVEWSQDPLQPSTRRELSQAPTLQTQYPVMRRNCSQAVYYGSIDANPTHQYLVDLDTEEFGAMPDTAYMLSPDVLLENNSSGVRVTRLGDTVTVPAPQLQYDATQRVSDLRLSPDGTQLTFVGDLDGDGDDQVYLGDLSDFSTRVLADRIARTPGGAVPVRTFSADGLRVAVASQASMDFGKSSTVFNGVREYELASGKLLWTSDVVPIARASTNQPVRVPGHRSVLFTGVYSTAGNVQLYRADLDQGATTLLSDGERASWTVEQYRVAKDASWLAVLADQGAYLEPWRDGESESAPWATTTFSYAHSSTADIFEPSARGVLFTAMQDRSLRWLDRRTGSAEAVIPQTNDGGYRALATPGPGGARRGVVVDSIYQNYGWQNRVTPLENDSDRPVAALTQASFFATNYALTPEGRYLLYSTTLDRLRVIDLVSGKDSVIHVPLDAGQNNQPWVVSFATTTSYADGSYLLAMGNMLYRVDLDELTVRAISELCDPTFAADTDLSHVVVCSTKRDRKVLSLIDLKSGGSISLLDVPGYMDPLQPRLVSPQLRWVLYEQSGMLSAVSLDGVGRARSLGEGVRNYAFDRTGRYLLGSLDGVLSSWDIEHPDQEPATLLPQELRDVTQYDSNAMWVD
ncbi:MAG: hypothetical protein QM778_21695 [Myxococcales bacterium]